jgi:glycosyltransferase involved in cell wall biosynthesis
MGEIWCGIPVFNNASTVADVVNRCKQFIADIIVIDDGSTDADLRELLATTGVTVVRHAANQGKGAALLTAFDTAARQGAKYLITLDGDGQHFPEDIPGFLQQLREDVLLIGARREVIGNMPGRSRFGRELSDFWICVETGQDVCDTQSGFRAYPLASINQLPLRGRHYTLEVEVVTRALWAGMKTASVPIRVKYLDERISSFRPIRDNWRISLMHLRLVLRQLVPWPHARLFPPERTGVAGTVNREIHLNSSPLGLAAAAGIAALLGIVLWPWGAIAVAYLAVRLHLNKIVALAVLLLCLPRGLAAMSVRIGKYLTATGSSMAWMRFVGAHVVALVAVPAVAWVVYAVARRFQPIAPATGKDTFA